MQSPFFSNACLCKLHIAGRIICAFMSYLTPTSFSLTTGLYSPLSRHLLQAGPSMAPVGQHLYLPTPGFVASHKWLKAILLSYSFIPQPFTSPPPGFTHCSFQFNYVSNMTSHTQLYCSSLSEFPATRQYGECWVPSHPVVFST